MKFLREKTNLKVISFIWLLSILSSCGSYYKLKQINTRFEEKINEEIDKGTVVYFVHAKNELFQISQPAIESNDFVGQIISTNQAELSFYRTLSNSFTNRKRFAPRKIRETRLKNRRDQVSIDSIRTEDLNLREETIPTKIHQVHIYTDSYSKVDDRITFHTDKIFAMQIFKKTLDPGLIFLIYVGGAFVLLLIILIISCNCPHIYMDNGKESVFTNTLFTGSVSKALERFDYKTLQDFHPNSSDLELQIKNENQEKQWTNVLRLTVAYHDPSVQVLTDLTGRLHTIQNPNLGINYFAHDGASIKTQLSKDDNSYFAFDHPTKNGLASAHIQFDKPSDLENAKLVLNVKNSVWAGFIHEQFLESLGDHHENWLAKNQNRSEKAQLAAMKKAGIPLVVSIKKDNHWVELESILAIGNANEQSIVIPINPELLSDPSIEIRIDSGFNLWEMDYVAMDFSKPANISVQHLSPSMVSGPSANLNALLQDDSSYLITEMGSQPIHVAFEGLKPNQTRTLILESKGYYMRQKLESGKTDWLQLARIASKHGIGKFSQSLYAETWKGLTHLGLSTH